MAWGNDYRNIVCPHCGRRIGDANGGSAFGGGIGGFGGIRGIDAPSRRGGSLNYGGQNGGSTKGYFGSSPGTFRLRSLGGPADSGGPEDSAGPRTTSYGTGSNDYFGMTYREDRFGRRRYL